MSSCMFKDTLNHANIQFVALSEKSFLFWTVEELSLWLISLSIPDYISKYLFTYTADFMSSLQSLNLLVRVNLTV